MAPPKRDGVGPGAAARKEKQEHKTLSLPFARANGTLNPKP